MNYCVVFIYRPTNSVATVWMSFESRSEAQRWATERITPNYSFEVRALCTQADWPAMRAVDEAITMKAGGQ